MAPRRSANQLLLAIKLRVSADDLPRRLQEIKGGMSYRRLARVLSGEGIGVDVDPTTLSRWFKEWGLEPSETE